jgi:predicted ATP-dependent Lon-type protease
MNEIQTPVRDVLDDKVTRVFAGKVVRKDLVRKVKVGANVPVFVLEYLLGKYCASSDEMAIRMGMQVVNDTLAENYIRPDEATKAQSLVKKKGGTLSSTRSRFALPIHFTGLRLRTLGTDTSTSRISTFASSIVC